MDKPGPDRDLEKENRVEGLPRLNMHGNSREKTTFKNNINLFVLWFWRIREYRNKWPASV